MILQLDAVASMAGLSSLQRVGSLHLSRLAELRSLHGLEALQQLTTLKIDVRAEQRESPCLCMEWWIFA